MRPCLLEFETNTSSTSAGGATLGGRTPAELLHDVISFSQVGVLQVEPGLIALGFSS